MLKLQENFETAPLRINHTEIHYILSLPFWKHLNNIILEMSERNSTKPHEDSVTLTFLKFEMGSKNSMKKYGHFLFHNFTKVNCFHNLRWWIFLLTISRLSILTAVFVFIVRLLTIACMLVLFYIVLFFVVCLV